MNHPPPIHSCPRRRGFALPTVIIVIAALMIMAVGAILVTGIERSSARSFVDQRRAEMAATISIEELRGIFKKYAENDDFYIVSQEAEKPGSNEDDDDEDDRDARSERVPYLFIAKGNPKGSGDTYDYRITPLFGAEMEAVTQSELTPPKPENFLNLKDEKSIAKFTTLPWMDSVKVNWRYVRDPANPKRVISRYAYFVEDMQGKLNPEVAGRLPLVGDGRMRSRWPDPNYKPLDLDAKLPSSSVIGLFALDPENSRVESNDLSTRLILNRNFMLTPESPLGASGLNSEGSANQRNAASGLLENRQAAAIEMNTIAKTQPYDELAVLPFAPGILPSRAGQVKLNLNQLLTQQDRSGAIASFANHIRASLTTPPRPHVKFEDRKGGLPANVDYLSTLAANALDYADADPNPTIGGNYLGLDGFPHISEIYLHVHYQGTRKDGERSFHAFRFQLFIELWNMTNFPVQGSAHVLYEVHMAPGQGSRVEEALPFDSPALLDDPTRSTHNLVKKDGAYQTLPRSVSLLPDEYKVIQMADVSYKIDYDSNELPGAPPNSSETFAFQLLEKEQDIRGISLFWNNDLVHRVPFISRRAQRLNSKNPIFFVRAGIPGHSYGERTSENNIRYSNNMGDPRISSFLTFGLNPRRGMPLSDNRYENISPGRRNIRRGTIYNDDSSAKRLLHGRVLPSEWPDGGHDSPVGNFPVLSTDNTPVLPTDPMFSSSLPVPDARNAPHRLSNEGVFFSATELGRVYDPILWKHQYGDLPEQRGSGRTDTLNLEQSNMPARRNVWPSVEELATESAIHGGGNTLRIGRPEHPKFDFPGAHAASLLDLFHVGKPASSQSVESTGNLIRIEGKVNINTATRDAIRALAAGQLRQDESIRRVTSWTHNTSDGSFSARKASVNPPISAPTNVLNDPGEDPLEADLLADTIIAKRPFASAAELATVRIKPDHPNQILRDQPLFGNKNVYSANLNNNSLQMTDAAAEEIFARVYEGSTLRSRNFRVWVVGQSINGILSDVGNVEVLAETRRAYSVFLDPGVRSSFGQIQNSELKIIHERDF